jgi:hypothetical protein
MLPRARTVSEVPNETKQRSLDTPLDLEDARAHPDTMTCSHQILTSAQNSIRNPMTAFTSARSPRASRPQDPADLLDSLGRQVRCMIDECPDVGALAKAGQLGPDPVVDVGAVPDFEAALVVAWPRPVL